MGKNYTRPRDFVNSEGVSNTIYKSPSSGKPPNTMRMSEQQSLLVVQEISELLERELFRKQSIRNTAQEEFPSIIFVVGKKDGGNRPVINLKKPNAFIHYEHFKMEGLHYLKFLLEQNNVLCKIDVKDAYFPIPLSKQSSKYVRCKWSDNHYEFLCLCSGLGPAPKVFTKLLKIPIALLRRTSIPIIVYLDDMLLMGSNI